VPNKPPHDPEMIFRQAVTFDYSARLLESATNACLVSLGRSGEIPVAAVPETPESQTPGGIYIPPAVSSPSVLIASLSALELTRVPTLIPQIVLQALALELYLKCILFLDGGNPWGHEVLDLYRQLSPVRQKRFEELYNEGCQNGEAFAEMQREEPEQVFDLVFALTEMNNAFKKWRYAYEAPGPRNCFLGSPWHAARRLILEAKPTWGDYAKRPDTQPA
jgi:hypothetical protein